MAHLPSNRRRREFPAVDALFDWDNFFPGFFSKPMGLSAQLVDNVPVMDFIETEDGYKVAMELPGVSADDVSISLDESKILTVTGEKKREEEHKDGDRYHSERYYGSFSRSLQLPEEVNPEAVTAKFTDGVLKISLQKEAPRKAKSISIDVDKG